MYKTVCRDKYYVILYSADTNPIIVINRTLALNKKPGALPGFNHFFCVIVLPVSTPIFPQDYNRQTKQY